MRNAALRCRSYAPLLAVLLLGAAVPTARSADLVADLSDHRIAITSGFTGATVLLFGARAGGGDVIVVLRGPPEALVVRRKAKIFGLWLNRSEVTFTDVPGYYALAASRPLSEIAPESLLRDLEIGFDNLEIAQTHTREIVDPTSFRAGLLRNMSRLGLYRINPAMVTFVGGQLFRTRFELPASVPTGLYHADTFLLDDGILVDRRTTAMQISKTGFEAAMFDFARLRPLLYGLVAVIVALVAGWFAGVVFRRG